MTYRNQNSYSSTRSRPTTTNQRRTDTHRVDEKWVGLIIGKKGVTVISLSKGAGNGCRIDHDRDDKGLFKISAWDSNAIGRAKIAIDALVKEQTQTKTKTKTKTQTKTKTKTHSRFAGLESDSDSDSDSEDEKRHAPLPQTLSQGGKTATLYQKAYVQSSGSSGSTGSTGGKKTTRQTTNELWRGESGRGAIIDAERKSYGRAKYAFLAQLEKTYQAIPKGDRKQSWENYKWDKLGAWNKARTQETSRTTTTKKSRPQASFESLPKDSFPELAFARSSTSEVDGAWGAASKPDWTVAVQKKPVEKEVGKLEALTKTVDHVTQVTHVVPTSNTASHFLDLVQVPPTEDCWSDDEEEDYGANRELDKDIHKTVSLVPPMPGGFGQMGGSEDWDTTQWA